MVVVKHGRDCEDMPTTCAASASINICPGTVVESLPDSLVIQLGRLLKEIEGIFRHSSICMSETDKAVDMYIHDMTTNSWQPAAIPTQRYYISHQHRTIKIHKAVETIFR